MRDASGVAWRRPPGKAGDREVEAAPEEMDGARLAGEGGSEMGEDFVRREEDAPKTAGIGAIVGGVGMVLIEENGIGDLARARRDPHVAPDLPHGAEQF